MRSRIEIISFPGQQNKEIFLQTNKQSKLNESVVNQRIREKSSTPTGNTQNHLLNIKDSLISIEENKKIINEQKNIKINTQEINQDVFIMNWKKYIQELKDDGHDALFNVLNNSTPRIKNSTQIYFEIYEKSYYVMIINYQKEIEEKLRKLFNNDFITLHFLPIYEEAFVEKKVNVREIFDEMAKKNTNLLYLKQIFNLDID